MAAGEYQTAAEAYGKLPRKAEQRERIADSRLLVNNFNYAEARRRAGELVPKADLKDVVALYERGAATESAGSVVDRLNHMQAMHIPYALLGNIERARQLIQQVQDLASAVSPRERVFSMATYTHMPVDEWLQSNRLMIEALDSGKLWDGTSLPAA